MAARPECPAPGVTDLTWTVVGEGVAQLRDIKKAMGEKLYEQTKTALRKHLCAYYDASERGTKQVMGVSPIQSDVAGWKAFKVRWALPGKGKRDGLRLAMIASCDTMVVKIVGAWTREKDPQAAEIGSAIMKGTK